MDHWWEENTCGKYDSIYNKIDFKRIIWKSIAFTIIIINQIILLEVFLEVIGGWLCMKKKDLILSYMQRTVSVADKEKLFTTQELVDHFHMQRTNIIYT